MAVYFKTSAIEIKIYVARILENWIVSVIISQLWLSNLFEVQN